MNVENKVPLTLDEAVNIHNPGERIFAIAVCSIPHLIVYHEPGRFRSNGCGSTTPDFLVINSRRSGVMNNGTYVEVTTGTNDHPRKKRQRIVMKKHPVRYVQIDARPLLEMQPQETIEPCAENDWE